ncbi:MAG: polysaccharide deacetylase family protein [Salinivirgaceae bacterium]|nr:polysaccharide deacetylase family protein [Salinivirgaceae bacterium]
MASNLFIKLLALITNQRLIFPFYHAVCDQAPIHLKHLYKVRSISQFENDIDFLLKNYTPVSITDIFNHLTQGTSLPKFAFHVSFDDGLKEFKDYAWPILKKKGIPVSLFINSSFVDNKELFYRFKASILIDFIKENPKSALVIEATRIMGSMIESVGSFDVFVDRIAYAQRVVFDDIASYLEIDFNKYLNKEKPYLSLNELKELNTDGVHIGAHSLDHPLFNQLNDVEKRVQLVKSVEWVDRIFDQKIKTFSFPFTDFGISKNFFSRMYDKENKWVDLSFGTAGIKKERFKNHLQRIPIEDSPKAIDQQLLQHYLYYLVKAPLFKNTIRR